ncbi:Hypothetical predicted protein, partial [Mytilus galloprovincialis]
GRHVKLSKMYLKFEPPRQKNIPPFCKNHLTDYITIVKKLLFLLLNQQFSAIYMASLKFVLMLFCYTTEHGQYDLFNLAAKGSYKLICIHRIAINDDLFNLAAYYNLSAKLSIVKDPTSLLQIKLTKKDGSVCENGNDFYSICHDVQDFYKKIIHIYSTEDTRLYTFLNTALRHQEEHNYRPTADDLALGPYILMFHLLLFHWRVLLPESGVTYRRMQLTTKDARQYKTGTTFFWLSFVSSSVVLKKATFFPTITSTGEENQIVLFIIDNNNESMWKPKNIEKYAMYQEKERVYPAAAKFEVTKAVMLKRLSRIT